MIQHRIEEERGEKLPGYPKPKMRLIARAGHFSAHGRSESDALPTVGGGVDALLKSAGKISIVLIGQAGDFSATIPGAGVLFAGGRMEAEVLMPLPRRFGRFLSGRREGILPPALLRAIRGLEESRQRAARTTTFQR